MLDYSSLTPLPTAEELPCSDETPVDNELQNLIPNLLLAILALIWSQREDWFFGVDMGIYYIPQRHRKPLVPDGFLSIGVERHKGETGRLSYVLWEEGGIVPCLAIECVSHTYNGEYDTKLDKYVALGVLYYVVYNPDYWQRHNREPFEVYRLVEGNYIRQSGEPVWMPEVGLGIGRGEGTYKGWMREWLYWYDEAGNCYPSPDDAIAQQQHRAELAEQRLEDMEAILQQYRDRFGDLNS